MQRPLTAFLACAVIHLAATVAPAATFRVDDAADAVDAAPGDGVCATAGGKCTLRAAVQEANAFAGADRIRLPEGTFPLQIGGVGEDEAATGDLDVNGRLRIVGAGAVETIVDGGALDRVFELGQTARVELRQLTVRGGKAADASGGGINAPGFSRLTLNRVVVEGNEARIGGGIATTGPLRMKASSVLDNVAELAGGLALFAADATIRSSTFDGNVATGNGGFLVGHDIEATGAALVTIANSTITGQIETYASCGEQTAADFRLSSVTVNDVSAISLGRPFCPPPEVAVTVRNTIVQQCHATLFSEGYNFVQPEGCFIAGDLTGVVVGDDPLLGSLKDNGGPTFTRLPVAVSAAVDGGNPATPGSGGFACEPFDQRGVPRYLGFGCDIGATEAH